MLPSYDGEICVMNKISFKKNTFEVISPTEEKTDPLIGYAHPMVFERIKLNSYNYFVVKGKVVESLFKFMELNIAGLDNRVVKLEENLLLDEINKLPSYFPFDNQDTLQNLIKELCDSNIINANLALMEIEHIQMDILMEKIIVLVKIVATKTIMIMLNDQSKITFAAVIKFMMLYNKSF